MKKIAAMAAAVALCLVCFTGCSLHKSVITGDILVVAQQCSMLNDGEQVVVVVTGELDEKPLHKGGYDSGIISTVEMAEYSYRLRAHVNHELTQDEISLINSGEFTVSGTYTAEANDGLHNPTDKVSKDTFYLSDCDISSADYAGTLGFSAAAMAVLTFWLFIGVPILMIVIVICFVRKHQGKAKHTGAVIALAVFETFIAALLVSAVVSWYICMILAIAGALSFYAKVSLGGNKCAHQIECEPERKDTEL